MPSSEIPVEPTTAPRRVLVAGASGFVGRRLCPALADGRPRRRRDDPPPRDLPGRRRAGLRRRPRRRHADRGARRRRRRLLPGALPRQPRLRAARRRGRHRLRAGRRDRGRRADRLPRRARQGGRRPLAPPALAPRGRGAARPRRRTGHDAAGRHRHRPPGPLVGDDPAAGRAAAAHGDPALGVHPHPADRAQRRGALPRRRPRRRGDGRGGRSRSAATRCCATPT